MSDRSENLVGQIQLTLTIDSYPDGRIGFGCEGISGDWATQEAVALLEALQKTINDFALANGFGPAFDCSKQRGSPS